MCDRTDRRPAGRPPDNLPIMAVAGPHALWICGPDDKEDGWCPNGLGDQSHLERQTDLVEPLSRKLRTLAARVDKLHATSGQPYLQGGGLSDNDLGSIGR